MSDATSQVLPLSLDKGQGSVCSTHGRAAPLPGTEDPCPSLSCLANRVTCPPRNHHPVLPVPAPARHRDPSSDRTECSPMWGDPQRGHLDPYWGRGSTGAGAGTASTDCHSRARPSTLTVLLQGPHQSPSSCPAACGINHTPTSMASGAERPKAKGFEFPERSCEKALRGVPWALPAVCGGGRKVWPQGNPTGGRGQGSWLWAGAAQDSGPSVRSGAEAAVHRTRKDPEVA